MEQLTLEEFERAILEDINERLKKEGDYHAEPIKNNKNNGRKESILIIKEGEPISPAIHMAEFYKDHQSGKALSDISREIIKVGMQAMDVTLQIDGITDYDKVKEKLYLRLANKDHNEEYLQEGPYRIQELGAEVVYLHLEDTPIGSVSSRITHKMLGQYGVTEAELFRQALENTERDFPRVLHSLPIGERLDIKNQERTEVISMVILTNLTQHYGAVAALYPGTLKELREWMQEDFYVLPSSLHETIAVPQSFGLSAEELRAIVREINREEVDREDILSNEVFRYSGKENKLEKCVIREREMER